MAGHSETQWLRTDQYCTPRHSNKVLLQVLALLAGSRHTTLQLLLLNLYFGQFQRADACNVQQSI